MSDVTIRDLRNHGGRILDRVTRGETLTVTRDGRPVAKLRPLARQPLTTAELLKRWRHLPDLNWQSFKADIDEYLDGSV